MSFGFITRTIDKLLCINEKDKKADMQLPVRVAFFGVAMAFCGLFLTIIALFSATWSMLLFAFFALAVSAYSFLSYKFQRIHVLSDTEFEYTTFLGKRKIYRFEHIRAIKSNSESHILILVDGRINVEPNTVMSERLKQLFNKELERIYKENSEKKARMKALKSSRSVRLSELSRLSSSAKQSEVKKEEITQISGEENENNG